MCRPIPSSSADKRRSASSPASACSEWWSLSKSWSSSRWSRVSSVRSPPALSPFRSRHRALPYGTQTSKLDAGLRAPCPRVGRPQRTAEAQNLPSGSPATLAEPAARGSGSPRRDTASRAHGPGRDSPPVFRSTRKGIAMGCRALTTRSPALRSSTNIPSEGRRAHLEMRLGAARRPCHLGRAKIAPARVPNSSLTPARSGPPVRSRELAFRNDC